MPNPSLDDDLFDSYDPDDVNPFPYLPDRSRVRESIANLNALITHSLDKAVGQILDQLDETGLAENTLVIFAADHGLAVPRAKGTGFDPGLEVAFVARFPGVLDGGERYSSLTSHVDVLPTVLDLLNLPISDNLDGRSFRNLFGADGYTPRKYVRAEMTRNERYVPMRVVRTKEFKYIRNFWKQHRIHLPADIFCSPAGREFHEEFYVTDRSREELYDLREDSYEQKNLAASRVPLSPPVLDGMFDSSGAGAKPDPDFTDELQRLRQHVYDWMNETDDPLLDDPVSRPGVNVWDDTEVTRT
ncbi:sulfatase-like hydrolase/transferase [Halocatena marina]|uniref:sulfatase-like hydrolase/transferase n=1 Tax=Halocatena marina TaxID=2934937 RepID=UPI00200FCE92|nr:sulfatase-like hydrolase/transferase [Halocatena marina]